MVESTNKPDPAQGQAPGQQASPQPAQQVAVNRRTRGRTASRATGSNSGHRQRSTSAMVVRRLNSPTSDPSCGASFSRRSRHHRREQEQAPRLWECLPASLWPIAPAGSAGTCIQYAPGTPVESTPNFARIDPRVLTPARWGAIRSAPVVRSASTSTNRSENTKGPQPLPGTAISPIGPAGVRCCGNGGASTAATAGVAGRATQWPSRPP